MRRKASLVLGWKHILDGGAIVEVKVWRLPQTAPDRPHGLKYSLFYGKPGERIIGYDNETGKGDHRHYREREEPYAFTTLEQLIADFEADVGRELRDERNPHQD